MGEGRMVEEESFIMKVRNIFIIAISLVLLVLVVGCSGEQSDNSDSTAALTLSGQLDGNTIIPPPPSGVPATTPSPFWIANTGGRGDFRNYVVSQLSISEDDPAYWWSEVYTLGEFYFVNVEIDGFEFIGIEISRYGVTFIYACVEESWDEVSIYLLREVSGFSRDEHWQGLTEQLMRNGRGVLTDDGMIYTATLNDIFARIGDTIFSIRVTDRLNSYEFLRDLALEVIETSELVVLELEPPTESQ